MSFQRMIKRNLAKIALKEYNDGLKKRERMKFADFWHVAKKKVGIKINGNNKRKYVVTRLGRGVRHVHSR